MVAAPAVSSGLQSPEVIGHATSSQLPALTGAHGLPPCHCHCRCTGTRCVVDPCVSCRPTCVKLARAGPSSTETMAERKAERKRKQAGKKKEKKAKEEAAEGDCPSQVYCLRDPCGLIDGVGPCGKGETCLSDYCEFVGGWVGGRGVRPQQQQAAQTCCLLALSIQGPCTAPPPPPHPRRPRLLRRHLREGLRGIESSCSSLGPATPPAASPSTCSWPPIPSPTPALTFNSSTHPPAPSIVPIPTTLLIADLGETHCAFEQRCASASSHLSAIYYTSLCNPKMKGSKEREECVRCPCGWYGKAA